MHAFSINVNRLSMASFVLAASESDVMFKGII